MSSYNFEAQRFQGSNDNEERQNNTHVIDIKHG